MAFSPDGQLLAKGFVNELAFSQEGLYLITNLGILNVQPGHEHLASNSTYKNPAIFIEQRQWINLNGKNVLWLPPDFRPSYSAINGDLLSLGHASGRVSFLRFRL